MKNISVQKYMVDLREKKIFLHLEFLYRLHCYWKLFRAHYFRLLEYFEYYEFTINI